MGLPQPKMLHGEVIRDRIPSPSPLEPARPIESINGEVAAMHSLIASRLAQQDGEDRRRDAHEMLEVIVSRISRLSGYAAMGLALAGLALLIF